MIAFVLPAVNDRIVMKADGIWMNVVETLRLFMSLHSIALESG